MKLPLLALLFTAGICLAADPHPSLPAAGSLDSFGVNIHFTHEQPGELAMIRDAGFKWVRMDLTWASTEKQKGIYDFSAYDHLVKGLDGAGLKAYFILDYGNPHYANPGEQHPFTQRAEEKEFQTAYSAWAAAAVKHFSGKGYLWEIWNEPNISGFWKPEPDAEAYAALAKQACTAIAKAAPGEALIGAATSTVDLDFLETCFKAGLLEHWAAVSVHPYRQTPPETAAEDYGKLKKLITRYAPEGKAIPILSGEWGYSTAFPCMAGKTEADSEEMQASYLLRMFVSNTANGIPLSIWYDWRDDGDNPKEVEHRFGIVRRAHRPDQTPVFEPKPAYLRMRDFTRLLGKSEVPPADSFALFQSLLSETASSNTAVSGRPLLEADTKLQIAANGDKNVPASATIQPISTELPGQAWEVKYKTQAGWQFFEITCQPQEIPSLPGGKSANAIGWWILGDASHQELRLRFTDATGQVFQPTGEKIDFTGWRFVTFRLAHHVTSPFASWGGAGDGVIHYPIRLTSPLIIDNVPAKTVEGSLRISSPVLLY